MIDKNKNTIMYYRGGFLGSRLDEKLGQFPLSEAIKVEVKRFPGKGRDRFQCRLITQTHTLKISQKTSNLNDIQTLAQKVHEFLELEQPVQFVD